MMQLPLLAIVSTLHRTKLVLGNQLRLSITPSVLLSFPDILQEYGIRSQSCSKLSEHQISHLVVAFSFDVCALLSFYFQSLPSSFRFTGVPKGFQPGAGSNFFKIPFFTCLTPSLIFSNGISG